jgi:hypothetical protein
MVQTVNDTSNTNYESLFVNLYYPEFNCPSEDRKNLDQPWISYYLNGGRPNRAIDNFDTVTDPFGYGTAVTYSGKFPPADWKANGASMIHIRALNPNTSQIEIIDSQPNRIDDIGQRGDGAQMTILLAENCSPRDFQNGGPPLGNTWSNTYFDDSGNFGIVPPMEHDSAIFWHNPDEFLEGGTVLVGVNQHKEDPLDPPHARPASNHPGVVVVTFCDGHTRKISETIDWLVYGRLMSAKGSEVVGPTWATDPAWQNRNVSEADLTQ